MYKVMLIDDEPIIVEGLTRSIPWEKYDCEVVATANDGSEGDKLIREIKPDIIFCDICMPNLSGLEMVAGLKSEFQDMEITILTGFREFDYVQTALRLGVTRFLLKPSVMDELIEAIETMTGNLKNKNIGKNIGNSNVNNNTDSKIDSGNISAGSNTNNNANVNTEKKEDESAASCFIVKNAMKYIEENYKQKLLLSDVAEKTYVSQWHLSKLLNKHTGQNFSEILNSVRIEKAKELLKDPSLRIGDIAEMVGFLDMAHFSRVFKKQVGISANEYRNNMID